MSWYQDVAEYIDRNLEDFIEHFFPDANPVPSGKNIKLNPSPCCGHNDCFTFSRYTNGAKCFSCGAKGTRIAIVEQVMGRENARQELGKWSGITFIHRDFTEEEIKAYNFHRRVQEIADKGIQFYHEQLMNNTEALEKQLLSQGSGGRAHGLDALKAFRVGLSGNYIEFYKQMFAAGYNNDELKAAGELLWIPDGYFVYPYFDFRGELVRINTKMWYRSCQNKQLADGSYAPGSCLFKTFDLSQEVKKAHEKETGHKMSSDGFSRGDKSMPFFFAHGSYRNQKRAILVEGENDVISVWEELQKLPPSYVKDFFPVAIGGNSGEELWRDSFLRQFESVYECFDLDDAGDKYRRELNEFAPDIPVYSISQDGNYKDIDSFLKSPANHDHFQAMLDEAQFVDTRHFLIEPEGYQHKWTLKNRKFQLVFTIDSLNKRSGQLEGALLVFRNHVLTDKKNGGIDSIKIDNALSYAKLQLSQHLDNFYNHLPMEREKPVRTFWELRMIIMHSREYPRVVRQLAWYLHHAEKEEYAKKVAVLQKRINQKVVAEILREVNGFENEAIDPHMLFPRIQVSQFFHVQNDDAMFYFSKLVRDGEVAKLVPCLLTNKKEEVRLDLLKLKDPQCLLLINNKYELPLEVPTAIMDPAEVSLQPYWVDRWKNGDLSPSDYDPLVLIGEIEAFIRRCYYTTTEIVKVLSLWIYATFFYNLFRGGFPYLIFTGPKGTGKSTFDTIVYLLSFNAKFTLDTTDAALFRMISFEGGTFILDEVENLFDKKSVNASVYAKILKGGYADLAYVYRTNMDKGTTERFSVFSPKVISNINGVEDVIGDRCIYIRTAAAPEAELAKLIDPVVFKVERRAEVHSITSRCVISALTYFQKVSELFQGVDSRMDTGNARLTQIMRPLLTMAKFVGGDYAEHLMNYYDKEIRTVKDEIAASTLEGMVNSVLRAVSEEFAGIAKEIWATDPQKHAYEGVIRYHANTGMFEINTLHIKVLCEETYNQENLDFKSIDSAMRNILGSKFNYQENRRRTHVTVDDPGLRRQLNEKKHVRVHRYYLKISQFVDQRKLAEPTVPEDSLF